MNSKIAWRLYWHTWMIGWGGVAIFDVNPSKVASIERVVESIERWRVFWASLWRRLGLRILTVLIAQRAVIISYYWTA